MMLSRLIVVFLFVVLVSSQDHYHYDNPPLVAGSFIDTVYTGTLSSDQVCIFISDIVHQNIYLPNEI